MAAQRHQQVSWPDGEEKMTMADDDPGGSNPPVWRDSLAGWVSACSLAAFFALIILMFTERGGSQTAWDRLVYLLTGVEAVAFASAGWLFGKEVHRSEAQQARKQVVTERQRVSQAQTDLRESVQREATEQEKARSEQERADKAESGVRQAEERATAERKRGMRLAVAAVAAPAQRPARRGGEQEAAASVAGIAPDPVAELARSLYPELFSDS
jgi:hypothetical protein